MKSEIIKTNEYTPESVTCPGSILEEWLDENYMTPEDLNDMLNVEYDIQLFIEGKMRLNKVLAKKLEVITNIPENFWMSSENKYRESLNSKK